MSLFFVEGLLKIANLVLSVIAAIIAIGLIKASTKKHYLKPWLALIVALFFFMIQETLGALRAFSIFSTSYLTHIVPTIILGFLIFALTFQINIKK